MSAPDTNIGMGSPSTGIGVGTTGTDGAVVEDGQAITVKPSNGTTASYQGTLNVPEGGTPSVTLPATVAMVEANAAVGLATSTGSSAGNGTAFVNDGFLTNVRFPDGNTLVTDGNSLPLSKEDNTGLLAMVTTHVANDTFENVALPHNYAVVEDGYDGTMVNQFDGTGSFAMVAAVSGNAVQYTLANATTRVVVNALPTTVKTADGATTAGATVAVDQGALTGIVLGAGTGIVKDGVDLTVPVTGTYTSKITPQVDANGVITGFTLS